MELFELSPELIELIIFGMENQAEKQVLDTHSLTLCKKSAVPLDDERYVDIPDWGPAQGYRLMESFVANLKNPIYKQELRDILLSGDKVFRRFKDALKFHPFLEKKWYWFKERQLKREVLDWYNGLRELAGLEALPFEPEDNPDLAYLIEESFSFSIVDIDISSERGFLLERFMESLSDTDSSLVELFFMSMAISEPSVRHMQIECNANEGETAGFCWFIDSQTALCLNLVYVYPEFRDMGIGSLLLEKFIDLAEAQNKNCIVRLIGKNHPFSDKLKTIGSKKVEECFLL